MAVPAFLRAAAIVSLIASGVGRYVLVAVSCSLVALWALQVLVVWAEPDPYHHDPFGDAITYLAAGERLNAGHALYELGPGDRPVMILDYPAPLLSPPAIAAIWRPVAALPDIGFVAWLVAVWFALLGTIAHLVWRLGPVAAVVVAALSWPLGEMLAAANVAAFFPGLLLVAWLHRSNPRWGIVIGVISVVKLAPVAMAGWWAGARRLEGIAAIGLGVLATGLVGLAGAGFDAHLAYLDVARQIQPSDLSLAGRLGQPVVSYVVLGAGLIGSAALANRPRVAFLVAYAAMVLGTPAVYVAAFGLLVGLLIPFVDVDHGRGNSLSAR